MAKQYSHPIADAVNDFLTEDKWNYFFDEGKGVFKFGLRMGGNLHNIDYRVAVHKGDYVVYAFSPIGIDEHDKSMLHDMAEFITRANYGMTCGNFEMDMRDGEIRFKCYVSCEGNAVPTKEIIRESIYIPARMYDRYAPGILGIVFQEKDPETMIAECENLRKEIRQFTENTDGAGGELRDALAAITSRLSGSSDSTDTGEEATMSELDEALLALTDLLKDDSDAEDMEDTEDAEDTEDTED